MDKAHLRVARPSDNLREIIKFYRDGLGFELIDSFEGHQGFDGVMLGHSNLSYHLEFTHHRGHSVGQAQTKENLLVFYLPNESEWQQAVDRMISIGYQPVTSYNPYWDVQGKTFEDADGYRIVLQRAAQLFGAADALREATGHNRTDEEEGEYVQFMSRLRSMLPEAELNTAWAEGKSMTMEQAIQLAIS